MFCCFLQDFYRLVTNLLLLEQCKSYLTKKKGMDSKEATKLLGITADFDCKCNGWFSLVSISSARACTHNFCLFLSSNNYTLSILDPDDKPSKKK